MPTIDSKPRILIIRLSALGDILHVLPALAALRAAMPGAFIGWLVEDRGAPILEDHPMIDALHVLPRKELKRNFLGTLVGPMRELADDLRARRYETAIDFQGLSKSAFWARLCGAPRRIGFRGEDAREVSRIFYNEGVYPRADQIHVIERNLALLRPLGIESPKVEFPMHLSEAVQRNGESVWGDLSDRYPRIVLNPGAGWKTKQWPAAEYGRLARELINEIGARAGLAWGPGEEPLVETALTAGGFGSGRVKFQSARLPDEPGLYPLPATSFMELGGVLAASHLYAGGDTGPTHLAAALGVPVVAIHGASDARRNGPWGRKNEVIQLTSPSCVPCWQTQCDWKEPLACLTHISVSSVRDACLRMLAGETPRPS